MYCAQCGTQVDASQRYCSRCGWAVTNSAAAAPGTPGTAPVSSASPGESGYGTSAQPQYQAGPAYQGGSAGAAGRSRVTSHLRTLGILWLVVSVFRLLPALGMLTFGHMSSNMGFGFPFRAPHFPFFLGPLLGGIGVFLTATAVIGLAAGWGLLERKPWARTFAIVIGCLSLLSFPFGTALGIYTLWVLASQGADAEYARIARV